MMMTMMTTDEMNSIKKSFQNSSYPDGSITPTTRSLSSTSASSGADQELLQELLQQQQQQVNSRKRNNDVVYIDDTERYNVNTSGEDQKHDIDNDDDEFDIGYVDNLDAMSAFSSITDQVPTTVHDVIDVDAYMEMNTDSEFTTLPYKGSTNRFPIELYLSCNDEYFSQYICHVRKSIEFFEATSKDVVLSVQGRNRKIVVGQVGIRCRYCYNSLYNPTIFGKEHIQTPGSMYFPSKLLGIYQTCQNIASLHLLKNCPNMTSDIRDNLKKLYDDSLITKKPVVGKELWAHTATAVGVYEDDEEKILRFDPCWSRKMLTHWLYL